MSRTGIIFGALAVLMAAFIAAPAVDAHHGWRWAEDDTSELTGTITSTKLGNPHGLVMMDVNGEEWTAEVGQPWRNERVGLTPAILKSGVTMTVRGNRSTDKSQRLIKAVRVIIDGKTYDLYPGRD